ncbi:hypothetical protein M3Y96_00261600 [Aphelenchoides besseyi]|nr:hypothetical protein M3Y96_00261600 [Aphelenchoides besseyi]
MSYDESERTAMIPQKTKPEGISQVRRNPTDKPKSSNEKSQSHRKITDIQGLRGIAILGVLLFHIRDDTFKVGFLGVDVFFVISGYLMCMLLSRYSQLDAAKILDFYFRRLKRIVPVYLFVILAVLLSAIYIFMYPFDYGDLFKEVRKPLFFAANIPNDEDDNYFAQSNESRQYLMHLWSLAVEVQFYCFVPFLISILNFFKSALRALIVLVIGCVSFWYQINSVNNEEHMSLSARVWQFMCGFIAYYIGQTGVLDPDSWCNYSNKHSVKYRAVHFVDRIVHLVVAIAIITLVTVRVFSTKSTSRLVLLSLAVLVIARSGESLILSNRLLVTLGDISYSVYMVHWPIFEFHRYVDVTTYSYRRRVSFPMAFVLITLSIFVGYLIEKAYNRISGYIRGWKSLISVILVLYLLIFASMDYLQKNRTNEEVRVVDDCNHRSQLQKILSMVPNVLKDMRHINNDMMEIWRTRNQLKPLNASFSMAYNIQFKKLSWELRTCPNTAKSAIPTTYNIVPMDIKGTCYQQGKGAKNIVLIGNSHAKAIYFGVEYHFRNIYANFTLLGAHQCMASESTGGAVLTSKFKSCQLFVDDMVKMLKAFKHPIDIIIVGNAYLLPYDPPINMRNLSLDPLYMEIQKRYTELAEIARDVVFVPRGHFDTGISNHLQTLQKRILYNQDLSMFRTPVWFNRQGFLVNLKKRVDLLNCSKCVVINWEDLWCNKTEGRCDTIDQFRRLSYFYDTNHHNAYGALHVGNFIRDLYNQWMEKQSKKVESPQNNSSTKQSINVKALNKPLDLLNDKLLNGTSQFNNLTDSIASNVKNNSSLQTVKNMTKTS